MIDRYADPRMKAIWGLESQYRLWLEVELLACQAQAQLGRIPPEALEAIRTKASFSVERIAELEAKTGHDLVAFLTNLAEKIGEEARYIHLGLTSSDIKDTALSLQMREALDLILEDVEEVIEVLKAQAQRYRDTIMVGRTHGVHAEPITLGLKLALWALEMERNRKRLRQAREVISWGKVSGALGTYAAVDPFVEEYVCRELGLKPALLSNQILQRDRHAEYVWALAITAASLEKFATEFRNLQRTEVGEVEEPFTEGQTGSSAMPHKRNPILAERISGQARLLRGYLVAALEDVALWGERDISHSSVERVILPQATILLDHMLNKFAHIVENMLVYPERMRENLERTQGLIFSEQLLLALLEKGLSREEAYQLVQRQAMAAWRGDGSFKELLSSDPEISRYLTAEEIDGLCDMGCYLRHLETIFARLEGL